jgi:error-prone DNA polymerase
VALSGIVLIRQRPGSANNVTFITIEDETGVANIIIWQRLFESARRTILGASMLGVRGRVQREGLVIHVIADQLEDHSEMLRSVGLRSGGGSAADGEAPAFPHRTGPGDGYKNAGPDARHPKARDLFYPAFRSKPYEPDEGEEATIQVKSRNFH